MFTKIRQILPERGLEMVWRRSGATRTRVRMGYLDGAERQVVNTSIEPLALTVCDVWSKARCVPLATRSTPRAFRQKNSTHKDKSRTVDFTACNSNLVPEMRYRSARWASFCWHCGQNRPYFNRSAGICSNDAAGRTHCRPRFNLNPRRQGGM